MLALLCVAACSSDEPTQTPESNQSQPSPGPTVEIVTPTPSPAPTGTPTPTPIVIPTPTAQTTQAATPSPTAVPTWDDYGIEALEQLSCETWDGVRDATAIVPAELYPIHRLYHTASVADNGRIVMGSGFSGAPYESGVFPLDHPVVDVYNPATDSWCSVITADKYSFLVDSVVLSDGSFLLLGGGAGDYGGDGAARAVRFEAESLTLTEVTPPAIYRRNPKLALLDDGRVLVAGGWNWREDGKLGETFSLTETEIYDPVTNSWSMAAQVSSEPLLSFRAEKTIFTPQWLFPVPGGGAVLATVGDDSENRDVGSIHIYDSTAGTWNAVASFTTGWGDPWHAMLAPEGKLVIFYERRVEIYDLEAGDWTISYSPRGIPRVPTTTVLPDGRVLVSGGATEAGRNSGRFFERPTASTDILDPETLNWAVGPPMEEARHGHSATVLSDGKVLIYGGVGISADTDELAPLNTVEILDAAEIEQIDTNLPANGDMISFNKIVYPCWKLTSGPESLTIVSNDPDELPDASQLVADSLEAMNTAESFAFTSLSIRYQGEPGQRVMDSRITNCDQSSLTYEAPDSLTVENTSFHQRSYRGTETQLLAEQTWYGFSQERDTWLVQRYIHNQELQVADVAVRQDTLNDSAIKWTTVAIENLNGEDVYHVQGIKSENEGETRETSSFDLWIGIADNLIRKMFIHHDSPGYVDPQRREQDYELVDFERYGEDFSIRSPLTPEEAAQPEASGGAQCNRAYRPEALPQSMSNNEQNIESVTDLLMRSARAMSELSSYETLAVTYELNRRMDPESGELGNSFFVLNCDWQRSQFEDASQLSSRIATIDHYEVTADAFRIVVGQNEYTRESVDSVWTRQTYDSSQPFPWPHTQFLDFDFNDPQFDLELVGIESLNGVDVYHISTSVEAEDEDRDAFSIWIGVEDLLLRRSYVVSSEEIVGEDSLHTTKQLVEFHSFNQDFNIQPPPEDQIAGSE